MPTTLTGDANAGWATAIGGNPDDGSLPMAAHIRTPVQAVLNDLARIGDRLGYNAGTANGGVDTENPSTWGPFWYQNNTALYTNAITKTVSLAVNQLVRVSTIFEAYTNAIGIYAIARLRVDDGGGYANVGGAPVRVKNFSGADPPQYFFMEHWYEAAVSGNHVFALSLHVDALTPGAVTIISPAQLMVELHGKRFPNDAAPL